jgi:hypothetical protein
MSVSLRARAAVLALLGSVLVTAPFTTSASAAIATISGTITANNVPVPAGTVQVIFIPYNKAANCVGGTPPSIPNIVTPVGANGQYSMSLDTAYDYKVMYKPLTTAPRSAKFRWYNSTQIGGTTDGFQPPPATTGATCINFQSSGATSINLATSGTSLQLTGTLRTASGSIVPPSNIFITRSTLSYFNDPDGYASRTAANGSWEIAGLDEALTDVYIQVMVPAGTAGAPRFFVKKAGASYSLIPAAEVSACGADCKFSFGTGDVSDMNFRLPTMGEISGTISGPNGPVGYGEVCATAYTSGGSSIDMYSSQVGSVCTDENGRYTVSVAFGSYKVQFINQSGAPYKSEWYNNVSPLAGYSAAQAITLSSGSPTTTISPTLDEGKSISGRVTDADGTPLEGVTVSAFTIHPDYGPYGSLGSARSNDSGNFAIRGLEIGEYAIMATHRDYGSQWLGGTRDTATRFTITSSDSGATGKNIQFPRGYKASGVITTDSAQDANVCVTAYLVTDTNMSWGTTVNTSCFMAPGAWEIKGLREGSYKFRFSSTPESNLRATFLGSTDATAATLTTITSSDVSGIDISLSSGKIITGKIVDNVGPNPITGVCVSAFKISDTVPWGIWSGSSCTNSAGTYLITGLEEGSYQLRFDPPSGTDFSPGWYQEDGSPTRRMDDSTLIVVSNETTTTAAIQTILQGPTFTAVAVDGTTPVAGVCVSALKNTGTNGWGEWGTSSCSGTDGKITLRGLAEGDYTFQVNTSSGSYQSGWFRSSTTTTTDRTQASSVTLGSSSVALGNISLLTGTKATGKLISSSKGVWGACVQALKDDGGPWGMWSGSTCTNSNGEFTLRGLDPTASYRFRVDFGVGDYRPGFVTSNSTLQSGPDGITALAATSDINLGDIAVANAPSIKGTVTSGASRPESNVCFSAQKSDTMQWISSGCSSSNGTFAIRGLTAGDSYRISWWTQKPTLAPGWYKELQQGPTHANTSDEASVIEVTSSGVSGLAIRLKDGAAISGTLDAGLCVAAWLHSATNSSQRTDASATSCANANNEFELRGLLPSTDYFLQVFKKDGTAITQTSPLPDAAIRTGITNLALTAS